MIDDCNAKYKVKEEEKKAPADEEKKTDGKEEEKTDKVDEKAEKK